MKTFRRLVLPLGLAAAVAGGVAAAGSGNVANGDDQRAVPAPTPPSAAVQAKQAGLLKHFAIDPRSQHRGATSRGGVTVYRSSAGETTCLVDENGAGHCPPTEQISDGRSFGGSMCGPVPAHLIRVTGLVPKDAVRVVVRTGAGTEYPLTPVDGTVALEIPRVEATEADHLTVTWTLDTGGTKSFETPLPPGIAGTRCG